MKKKPTEHFKNIFGFAYDLVYVGKMFILFLLNKDAVKYIVETRNFSEKARQGISHARLSHLITATLSVGLHFQ
jgi:hypothetical protein